MPEHKIVGKTHDIIIHDEWVNLDPDLREWEYEGTGKKVWKGTMRLYKPKDGDTE